MFFTSHLEVAICVQTLSVIFTVYPGVMFICESRDRAQLPSSCHLLLPLSSPTHLPFLSGSFAVSPGCFLGQKLWWGHREVAMGRSPALVRSERKVGLCFQAQPWSHEKGGSLRISGCLRRRAGSRIPGPTRKPENMLSLCDPSLWT